VIALAAILGWLSAPGVRAAPGNAAAARAPDHLRPPGATASEQGPSPVIFPPQSIPLRFDHRLHTGEIGLSCATCHPRALDSRKSADRLLPDPTVCDGCHTGDHRALRAGELGGDASSCSMCHQGHRPEDGARVLRVRIPEPNLRFDHAAHARRNIQCQQCHGAVQELGLATVDQMPRMRGCFRCHDLQGPAQGDAKGECVVCHLTTAGGARLETRFASGELVPPRWLHASDHGPGWLERHKEAAAADSAFCATCHEESECVDCHDGRVRPRRTHPNDWLALHTVAALQNSPVCTDCHRQQSFCLGCHQRAGVTRSGPLTTLSTRGRFHPPRAIWTDPPRSPRHHAWEAQRNMDVCVSCHTERDCATCHATTAMGGRGIRPGELGPSVNPHPAGFANRCAGVLRRNARPCLTCHRPDDPDLAPCR
jgi:hypothetical protein